MSVMDRGSSKSWLLSPKLFANAHKLLIPGDHTNNSNVLKFWKDASPNQRSTLPKKFTFSVATQ